MHKWTWSLTAVALLGLAGCKKESDRSRGQQADRAQLQEGSQVRASYDELGGRYEATLVELYPKAPSPQRK